MARPKDPKKSGPRKRGYVTVDGQKYWVQGYTVEEFEANKEKKLKEVQAGIDEKGGHMTVRAWSKDWLEIYKSGKVNLRHYKDIENQLNNWILPVVGKMPLKSVRQLHIQKIIDRMQNLSNKEDGYSASYIKKVYDIMHSLFQRACDNRYITYNPVVNIELPETKMPVERRPITEKERAVIEAVASEFDGGIFYLIMLYSGLRPSEVAALRWRHIDFDEKVIHVRDALKSDNSIAETATKYNGKTVNARRDVFISEKLEKALKDVQEKEEPEQDDFVAHKRKRFTKKELGNDGKKHPVKVVGNDGKKHVVYEKYNHHTKTSMRTMWEGFKLAMHIYMGGETDRSIRKYMHVEKDGNNVPVGAPQETKYTVDIPIDDKVAKDLVPYDLRHTFCTDLRDRGVPIEVAKDLMGHADISLTAKIYSHSTVKSIDRARLLYDGKKEEK